METTLSANQWRWLWPRVLLILPPLAFVIVPEGRAQSCLLRTPALNLIGQGQKAGAQYALTPSRTFEGQIEDPLAKGNLASSRTLMTKLLVEPNVSTDTLLGTGTILGQHELFPEAADVCERCVKDHPKLFEGYYNLALAQLALRNQPAALATRGHERAQSVTYFSGLKPEEAVAVLRHLLEGHPDLASEGEETGRSLLHEVHYEDVAAEIEDEIRALDYEDVNGRAGGHPLCVINLALSALYFP